MGFTEIEKKGKELFEQFPAVKRAAKRLYQLVSYAISNEKFKVEGDVVRVSPDDGYEYFYGYYDKSPWNAIDRYMIALRVKQAYKSVAPKEAGTVGLIDTQDGNRFIEIGSSRSWNVQQGCMAQCMGPDFKSRIIYNDFREGKYCAVIYDWTNKCEEKVLPLPVYDVAKDGSFALSLDFSRLHRLRPGYGYSNLPDNTKGELCPNKPCIWKVDFETGKVSEMFKYTDFAAFEPDESMIGAEHKVNHLMISPNGKRFMVLHRWFHKGRKHTRLVTVNVDKTEMYNLSDDVFVSHCYWKNDYEILSFLRKKETGDHYYLMKDKTCKYTKLWSRLVTDGHCSYSPNGSLVITDSYPNRKRLAFVYVCREEQDQPVKIASVFSPFRYDNDCRCDLHPRWNHAGDKICIDSVHEGKRGIYVISITQKYIPPIPGITPDIIEAKYKVVYLITNCKNSGPMNQTLNIIKNLDRNLFQPIIVTLFLEDLANSVIQRFLDIVPEFYCLNMGKISSIFTGKKQVACLLGTLKPDLIVGLGMPPYRMSLGYKKAAHLVTLRNYCYQDYPDKYGKIIGKFLAWNDMTLIKRLSREGEKFLVCSESLAKLYKEKDSLNIDFIRNGVDISKYRPIDQIAKKAIRGKLGLPIDKTILSYAGQFNERKDQQFAITGLLNIRNNDNLFMILMGDGPCLEMLKSLYGGDSHFLFTGNINNVSEYLQASDLYVSTSKSEGMPNGVLEAMATGLPVLLSDIPQHLEVLEVGDSYGISYHIGDMDDFVQKLGKILECDLNGIGKKACQIANNDFSATSMSKQYQEVYLELLKK